MQRLRIGQPPCKYAGIGPQAQIPLAGVFYGQRRAVSVEAFRLVAPPALLACSALPVSVRRGARYGKD